jgi:hypothetical protein
LPTGRKEYLVIKFIKHELSNTEIVGSNSAGGTAVPPNFVSYLGVDKGLETDQSHPRGDIKLFISILESQNTEGLTSEMWRR